MPRRGILAVTAVTMLLGFIFVGYLLMEPDIPPNAVTVTYSHRTVAPSGVLAGTFNVTNRSSCEMRMEYWAVVDGNGRQIDSGSFGHPLTIPSHGTSAFDFGPGAFSTNAALVTYFYVVTFQDRLNELATKVFHSDRLNFARVGIGGARARTDLSTIPPETNGH